MTLFAATTSTAGPEEIKTSPNHSVISTKSTILPSRSSPHVPGKDCLIKTVCCTWNCTIEHPTLRSYVQLIRRSVREGFLCSERGKINRYIMILNSHPIGDTLTITRSAFVENSVSGLYDAACTCHHHHAFPTHHDRYMSNVAPVTTVMPFRPTTTGAGV